MASDRNSITSLAIPCQCSTIVTMKNINKTKPQTTNQKPPCAYCALVLPLDTPKDFGSIFFIPSQQVFVHSEEIPPDPSLPQPKQFQLSQLLLLCQMLQLLHPLCGPLLNSFQDVYVSLVLGSTEWELVL